MTLKIHNLAFERNYRFLFSDINESLNPGELLQIRGTNGAGKSTLLRILAGFIEPHAGNLLWHEKPLTSEFLLYLGHHNGVKPYLTVQENIKLFSALARSVMNPIDILKKMQLEKLADTSAQFLSAGQLRRLALTRLLLQPKPLWILDEPTTSLDTVAQDFFVSLLTEHLKNNGIAIIATHQPLMEGKYIQLRGSHV